MLVIISSEAPSEHLNLELQHSMRLFRAQRNFYISGFSIFLVLVIRRLVTLISSQAQLLAQSEASMRQAQSATTAARSLLSQQKTDDDKSVDLKEAAKSNELVSFNYLIVFYFLVRPTPLVPFPKQFVLVCHLFGPIITTLSFQASILQ